MSGAAAASAGFIIGILLGGCGMALFQKYHKKIYYKRISHEKQYLNVMHQWLILKQKNMSLSDILKEYHVNHTAVYGMGILGRHIIRELEGTGITVDYGIDQKNMDAYKDIMVYPPNHSLQKVDAVINTVVWAQREIEQLLKEKLNCPVLNLEELVFDRYGLVGTDRTGD